MPLSFAIDLSLTARTTPAPVVAASPDIRITEAGDTRITEASDTRIQEAA